MESVESKIICKGCKKSWDKVSIRKHLSHPTNRSCKDSYSNEEHIAFQNEAELRNKQKKSQKNVQQSSQPNQDRPQTLPTESHFPTLGGTANPSPGTSRGQILHEFPALGVATRLPIPQAVAQTDEVTFQPQAAGKVF